MHCVTDRQTDMMMPIASGENYYKMSVNSDIGSVPDHKMYVSCVIGADDLVLIMSGN